MKHLYVNHLFLYDCLAKRWSRPPVQAICCVPWETLKFLLRCIGGLFGLVLALLFFCLTLRDEPVVRGDPPGAMVGEWECLA